MRSYHTIWYTAFGTLLVGALLVAKTTAATVPAAESFESYTNDHPIVLESDWTGESAVAGLVSTNQAAIAALVTYTNAGGTYPLPGEAHDKVLALTKGVSNAVSSAVGGVVNVEWLVLPSQREAAPLGSTDDQMAFYVSTNSELVIWHNDVGGAGNQWLTLSGNPAISSNDWVRVTVVQDYATDRFQISINGTAYANAIGETRAGGNPGTWFSMVQTNKVLSSWSTEGKTILTYVDDLVFTNRSVNYGGTSFSEAVANNGSVGTSQTITLSGDTFVNTAYASGTHFNAAGVPAGLTLAVTYVSPTTVSVSLTGNASPHTSASDTSGMSLTLLDDIFTLEAASDVTGYTRSDLSVSFDDAPVLAYGATTFTEAVANDGSIANSIVVTLTDDTFADDGDFGEGDEFSVSGVPSGLTTSITRDNATQVTVTLTGNAASHGDANDTSMTLTFQDAAFDAVAAADITDSAQALSIDFADDPEVTYSTNTFTEVAANNGALNGGTITVIAENFTGTVGTNYVIGGEVLVSNLPAGLSVSIQKTAATMASITFSGTATSHLDTDDISNLTFAFQNGAFSGGDASAVVNATRSDLVVDFAAPPVVTYSASTFTEASNNNGTIGNTLTVTLTDDTFVDDGDFGEGDEYTVANEPGGLSVSITRDNATQLTVSLTGTAGAHATANDISNLTITLGDAAFTTVAAADITDATRNDLGVDFNDQPVIAYSGTIFTELSFGEIDNTSPIEITISGDSFSGANGSDFVSAGKVTVGSVPPGLTVVLTKDSATKLLATLTGTATSHDDVDDVTTMAFTFEDAAFAADAIQVTGYTRSDLQVDFNDSVLAINTVPYQESFESYANGYQIGNLEGWDPSGEAAVTNDALIVGALGSGVSFGGFPLATTHTKVLCVTRNSSFTDEVKSSPGESIYTDVMLYVTAREEEPIGETDDQFAIYFDTNGYVVAWHQDTSGVPTNTWTTLSGSPSVTTGAWHRVSIEQDFVNYKYKFRIDGAFDPLVNPTTGGPWFNMVSTANDYLSQLVLLGGTVGTPSYVDDINVTNVRFPYWDRSLFQFK